MAYRRQNIFYFDSLVETGIDKIPVNHSILVKDIGKELIKKSNTGITENTTLQEALEQGVIKEIVSYDYHLMMPDVQMVTSLQAYADIKLQAEIVNYDPTAEYSFGVEKGKVLGFKNGIMTYKFDAGRTGEALVSVYSSKPGHPNSRITSNRVVIIRYGEDTTWALRDTPESEQSTLISTSVGNFKAPQIVETEATSPATGFTSTETVKALETATFVNDRPITKVNTIVKGIANVLELTDGCAANLLETKTEIKEGDTLILNDSVETTLGSVTQVRGSSVNTHDIFGDGSCIATYNLDGNANDLGGNYNGTATNVTYKEGKFGQCAVFGADLERYFDTGIPSNISSKFSYSVWFQSTGVQAQFGRILTYGDNAGIMVYNNGRYELWTSTYTAIGSVADKDLGDGNWHFVTVTFDGSTLKGYVDGVIFASGTMNTLNTKNNIFIGSRNTTHKHTVNGNIDQVRIFNRALTAQEVQTLYNEDEQRFRVDVPKLNGATPTKAISYNLQGQVSVDNGTESLQELPKLRYQINGNEITSIFELKGAGVRGTNLKYKFQTTLENQNIKSIETTLRV